MNNEDLQLKLGIVIDKVASALDTLTEMLGTVGKLITKTFDNSTILKFARTIENVTDGMIIQSQAQTIYNKKMQMLQVAYGKVNSTGEKLVKTMSDLSGLNEASLTSSLATYRQFASSLGIASENADLLSENVLKLNNDLASYYGVSSDEFSTKLISALTGETEAMKKYGVDVSNNAMQQKLFNLGIDESVANLSTAEKTLIRYLLIVDQTTNAQGNFASTINDVHNQTEIWNSQLDTLKRQLGAFLIPMLETILPLLNGILMVVNELLGMLLGLAGIEVGYDSIASSAGNFASNMEAGVEATEAAKRGLRGFDKLNVITTPTSTSSSGGASVGGIDSSILSALDEYNDKLAEANNKAVEIRNNIMEWLGFAQDTNGEWEFMGITFGTVVASAGVIATIVLSILKVVKGVKSIKSLITKVLGVGGSVSGGTGGSGSFELPKASTIIKGLGELALIVTAVGVYVTAVGALIDRYPNLQDYAETGGEMLYTVFSSIAKIMIPLAVLTAGSYFAGKIPFKDFAKGFGELALIITASTAVVGAIGAIMGQINAPVLETGVDAIVTTFTGLQKILVPLLLLSGVAALIDIGTTIIIPGLGILALIIIATMGILDAIGLLFTAYPELETMIDKGIDILCRVFEGLGEMVGSFIGGIAETVIDIISNTLPNLGTKLSEFAENAKGFFDTINNIDESSARGAKYAAQAMLYITASNLVSGLGSAFEVLGAITNLALLPAFGKKMKEFQDNLGDDFDGEFVESAANAAKALTDVIKNLPKSGGISGIIGTKDLNSFSSALPAFGKNMASFYQSVKNIEPEVVEDAASSAKALTEVVDNLPKSGGAMEWLTGEKDLTAFSDDLPAFGVHILSYYNQIKDINVNQLDQITTALANLIDFIKENGEKKVTTLINGFSSSLSSVGESLKTTVGSGLSYSNGYDIGKNFGRGMGSGISAGIKAITLPKIGLTNASGITEKTYQLKAYAEGGFPDFGELFLSRENGIPEMVGRIGTKTAVANNDQIVDGISKGVADAISGNATNVVITAESDTQGLLNFIDFKQKQKDRQYGF